MNHGNWEIKKIEVVLLGEISGQNIDDEAFVGVDHRPPVTVVKDLTLELFKYLLYTGIQFQWT